MNAQTLPQLLDAALNERNVTPEKRARYHDRLNRLSLLLLAEMVADMVAEDRRVKEGQR